MADNVSRHSKSGKTMNKIEFIIFGAIILYIIVIVINYMKSVPIKGYEIQMGSLSVSKAYTGVALRKEKLIQSPYTGYINFYVREGERVSSRDNVYSIDESGKLASMLNSGELGENIYSDEDLSEFRTEIIQYDRVYDDKQFNSVYDFKYELEGDVVKLINSNMYENMEELTASMEPSLYNGQKIFLNRLIYKVSSPKLGDVVVFLPNGNEKSHYYVKRILGTPGDTLYVKGGILYVNDEPVEIYFNDKIAEPGVLENEVILEDDEYFVIGDNCNSSEDSRSANIGMVKKEYIIGKAWFKTASGDSDMGLIE